MAITVAVTRPLPQADGTARRLAARGYAPVIVPLLTVEPLSTGGPMDGFAALAFTSRTAPALLAGRSDLHDAPVFAVGEGTASEARRAGFRAVTSADGDVAALGALIARAATGPVLHFSGEEQKGDLVATLGRHGIAAERRVLYRMVPAAALPAEAPDVVTLFSPRTAAVFAALATGTAWADRPCVALSPDVAATLPACAGVAERPTEAALLDALAAMAPPAPPG